MMLLASVGLSVSQAAVAFTKELLQAQILLGILGGFFFNNFVYTSNIVFQVIFLEISGIFTVPFQDMNF